MTRVQVGDDNGLVKDGHNGTYNNRFYMDLEGSMKVNDHATARFTVEKNAHYRDSEYANSKIPKMLKLTRKDGTTDFLETTNAISGIDKDSLLGDDNHNGSISNIWVELQLGKNHNWYTNIGRKWNGIGMQNLMLGGQVDGIATYHPIEGGHGWWMSAQYWKPSADWTTVSGTDQIKETFKEDGSHKGWDTSSVKINTHRAPIVGSLDFWGPIGKYLDANIAYSRVVDHTSDTGNSADGYYTGAKNFYGVDLKAKLFKDFSVTGSYLKSDALLEDLNWLKPHADRTWAVRFDYRGTDLNKVGSWGPMQSGWISVPFRISDMMMSGLRVNRPLSMASRAGSTASRWFRGRTVSGRRCGLRISPKIVMLTGLVVPTRVTSCAAGSTSTSDEVLSA